jgi:hypothetical protein
MSVSAPNAHYSQSQLITPDEPETTYTFSDAKAEDDGRNKKSPREICEVDDDALTS